MTFDPAAAGWQLLEFDDGFANLTGPFWKRTDDGVTRLGLVAGEKHINMRGIVHGGLLMTFADQVMGRHAQVEGGGKPSVTIDIGVHFISPARLGDFIEARAEIVRRTASVVFVQGTLDVSGRTIATAQGIWKVLSKPIGAVG